MNSKAFSNLNETSANHLQMEIQTLQRQLLALEEKEKKKQRIFGSALHDLRTPLCLLIGAAEEIGSDKNLASEELIQWKTLIKRNAWKIEKLLTEFSRKIENTESSTHSQTLSLPNLPIFKNTSLENPPASDTSTTSIWVVEDNPEMCAYLYGLLKPHWEVQIFQDGKSALAEALIRKPDLILSDVLIPELDGFRLLQELRQDPRTREVPIILLSARSDKDFTLEGFELGADDYVTKPFAAQELVARIKANLKMVRIRQELYFKEQALRTELEKRVLERTAELAKINEQLKIEIQERKKAEKEILEISEKEQRRLGEELHDGLCQHLTGVAFMTEVLAQSLLDSTPATAAEVKRIGNLIEQSVTQARNLARGFYPIEVDAEGLISALQDLARQIAFRSNIVCEFHCNTTRFLQSQEIARNLYLVALEATQNAIRHGKAKKIVIRLDHTPSQTLLEIRDNGCGFTSAARETKGKGIGLHIMNYRAKSINATLSLSQEESGNTLLTCVLPTHSLSDNFFQEPHAN